MSEKWIPQPVDTSQVELPEFLDGLTERLAENTHDVWAAQRIAMGWTFGPERNDSRKETPLLVPYAQLPEDEKEYDRKIAVEMLRSILYFGCEIRLKDVSES